MATVSGDLRATDLKNDIAALETILRGNSVGVDLSDHNALRPASSNIPNRRDRHAKLRQARGFGVGVRVGGTGLS